MPVIKVSEITPTDAFYHVSKNFFDPSPSAGDWRLEFRGMVNKPYALTYEQLTALPAIKVTTGMMCISNPIGGGLIGNTTWKGVRFGDLIKKASPQAGVVDVLMRAVDDYSDSIPYKKALDPNVVLVWEMGGQPLTPEHGFPARLLVPGIYGMKHVKWLTSVELVNYDFKGFWQDPSQGWSDPAPVNTMSRIDYPTEGGLDMKPQNFSGVAFAGDRSISKVEISTDGGRTWNQAYVKPPRSGTSWVVWGYRWTPPKPGKYTVQVRATDGKGNLQTAKVTDPYPNGATGYHTVTYSVRG
jgi:DMSO/TMAO reductase YedYZ molybdopterin-dependent catalytic subunit